MLKKLNIATETSEIKNVLKEFKSSFIYIGVASMFINILNLVPSLYMLQLYDRVLASRSDDTLLMLTLIVVFLFIMMALLELVRSRILVRIGNKIDAKLSPRVFHAMFSLANDHPGTASARPLTDLTQIRQFLTGTPIFALFDAPWMPIYIAVLFMFSPYYGWFSIFAAIVVFALMLINEKKTKEPIEDSNKAFQNSSNFISASLRNSEVIEAMGMRENVRQRWFGKYVEFLNTQSKASDEAGVWSNSTKSVRIMAQSLILGLGALLVIRGDLTAGMMVAGSIIMGKALGPLDLLTSTWKQFANARESYHRLEDLLGKYQDSKEPTKLPAPLGRLTVEGIIVIPPGGKNPSLKSVSMDIEPGQIVAIIGPSAAGKSTLARTMLGVWKPQVGKVRIDLAELDHWNKNELGKHIGYLPQDVELFEGTIAENIARFNAPDPQKIVDAAQTAGVHEMILRLPQGYDTNIGVGGATLSGGQRQRVGLARALYGTPKIIVLDEPNSNLDDVGENALMLAILELKKRGSTIILVTHRPSILGITDKIALLVDGTLQMYGDRDEVLNALAQRQKQAVEQHTTNATGGGQQ